MITRRRTLLATAIGAALSAVLLALAPVTSSTAAPLDTSCEYADADGGGKYPTSICWIDWTGFNAVDAGDADGQPVTMQMGAYTATFTVHKADVPGWTPRDVQPNSAVFTLGTPGYYDGIDGLPVLYAAPGNPFGAASIEIRDFAMTLGGVPVSGYSLVSASPEWLDAPTGVLGEQLLWDADQPMNVIDHWYTHTAGGGCAWPPAGDGTSSIWCSGAAAGTTGAYGVIVAANGATRITGNVYMNSRGEREGVTFGVQTSSVTLTKDLASRVDPSDAFDVSITSTEGQPLAIASTGAADSATTGATVVVPNGTLTLSEAASAGAASPLDYYERSWSCINATAGSSTVLPTGADPSQTLTPAIGDQISCSVTNTALRAQLALSKTADVSTGALGDTVTYGFAVTNSGQLPIEALAISEDAFSGSGTLSAVSCAATALAVGASTTCTATYEVTQPDVDVQTVVNTATATGFVTGTSVVVSSDPSQAVVDTAGVSALSVTKTADLSTAAVGTEVGYTLTATNTGANTLTDVTLVDQDFTGSGDLADLDCDIVQPTSLAPGEAITCTTAYTLVAGDTGAISNTASAQGTDPTGGSVIGSAVATIDVALPPRLATSGVAGFGALTLGALLLVVGGSGIAVLAPRLGGTRRRGRHAVGPELG